MIPFNFFWYYFQIRLLRFHYIPFYSFILKHPNDITYFHSIPFHSILFLYNLFIPLPAKLPNEAYESVLLCVTLKNEATKTEKWVTNTKKSKKTEGNVDELKSCTGKFQFGRNGQYFPICPAKSSRD